MPTWRCRPKARATTSNTHVETVARLYELFRDGRVEDAIALLDPDIDWLEPREQPDRHVVHGRDAAHAAVNDWLANWSDYEIEVKDVLEGERGDVLVCMRQRARGTASGLDVESDLFHVWTVRDGAPVRMEMFLQREAACEAAAVRPS